MENMIMYLGIQHPLTWSFLINNKQQRNKNTQSNYKYTTNMTCIVYQKYSMNLYI